MIQVVALDDFMIETLRELIHDRERGLVSGDIVAEDKDEAVREIRAIRGALETAEAIAPTDPEMLRTLAGN